MSKSDFSGDVHTLRRFIVTNMRLATEPSIAEALAALENIERVGRVVEYLTPDGGDGE